MNDRTLNHQWVLIAHSTKVLHVSSFSLTAHLPVQDVSGAAETHFGAAQTTHFEPCYEHPKMLLPPTKMSHNKHPILIYWLLLGQCQLNI